MGFSTPKEQLNLVEFLAKKAPRNSARKGRINKFAPTARAKQPEVAATEDEKPAEE